LVYLAFQKIDKDGNGELNLQDVMDVYDASQHPDVMSGKRKPEDVLLEFLETFDVGGEVDGKVTLSEFENYYANLSASIDDDDYFELMIRNAWHISGGEGWCANSSNRRVLVTDSSGNQRVEEIKDDLGLRSDDKTGMMARLRAQGASVSNIDLYSGGEHGIGGKAAPPRSAPQKKGVSKAFSHETTSATSYIPSTGYLSRGNEVKLNRPGSAGYQNLSRNVSSNLNRAPKVEASNLISYNHPSLELLRNQLKSRGANGISGLSRAFRRMDFDGSKSLSYDEFSRALNESGLVISEPDKRRLFLYFDRDRGGSVDYNEFLVGIRVCSSRSLLLLLLLLLLTDLIRGHSMIEGRG
jgi:calcyphosin